MLDAVTPFNILDISAFFESKWDGTVAIVWLGDGSVGCPAVFGSNITPECDVMWFSRVCCFSDGKLVRTW